MTEIIDWSFRLATGIVVGCVALSLFLWGFLIFNPKLWVRKIRKFYKKRLWRKK